MRLAAVVVRCVQETLHRAEQIADAELNKPIQSGWPMANTRVLASVAGSNAPPSVSGMPLSTYVRLFCSRLRDGRGTERARAHLDLVSPPRWGMRSVPRTRWP